METWYLIDAITEGSTVRLRFFDPVSNQLKEFRDSAYKPYFFLPYPLSPVDQENVHSLHGEVENVRKIDLYTNEHREIAKVKVNNPYFLKKNMKKFEPIWESEIEFTPSYVYDHGSIFGAQHTLAEDNRFTPVLNASEDSSVKFNSVFSHFKDVDPSKYERLKRWFVLLQQPVPQIKPDLLGIGEEVNFEKYFAAFVLSRLVNLPVTFTYTRRRVSDLLKSMMYNDMRRNNVLIPTSRELRRGLETHAVTGALTLTPKSGVYFNTIVTDFESLYPSCIDSYNLSYETVDCAHEECKANMIQEVGHHICTKRRGFFAALVGALKDLRIHWFKPLSKDNSLPENERRQAEITARLIKHLTVSSYGVTVRIHGLAYPPLAESITGYGRWALQTTWNMAEQNGLKPIYGDTDSIFLENASTDKVEWLIKTVKEKLRLDLAVEKRYPVCVLSKAKKAYFGILPDGTPDLKGLTAIKSNAPNFIQNVFKTCAKELSAVTGKEEYESAKARITQIVEHVIKNLKERKVELKDLVYSVKLYHNPVEELKAKVLFQPYQCAAQLIDSGREVRQGDTVLFVKVKPFIFRGRQFTVKPADKVQSTAEINVDDYIRNLTTALNQTFKPMEISFSVDVEAKITDWLNAKRL